MPQRFTQQTFFFGFSTVGTETNHRWALTDIDLIRRDLLNHFNTRVGERVMRPTFGCRIWDWLDDPFTSSLSDDIVQEAIRICEADTRVQIVDVQVATYDHGIRVQITLNYVPYGITDTFMVDFENQQAAEFGYDPTTTPAQLTSILGNPSPVLAPILSPIAGQ